MKCEFMFRLLVLISIEYDKKTTITLKTAWHQPMLQHTPYMDISLCLEYLVTSLFD